MALNRYSRTTYYLLAAFIVFVALLWTTARADAQDETATPVVDATDEPDTVVVVPGAYDAAINGLSAVIVALIVAGGAAAVAVIFRRNPTQAKTTVNTGIDVLELLARFTKTTADDEALQRIRSEFNARIDQILLNMPAPALIVAADAGTQASNRSEGKVTTTTTTEISGDVDSVEPPNKPVIAG